MSERLDKLKQILQEAPDIKVPSEAKRAAISAGMAAFAEEKTTTHQGNNIDNRPKGQDDENIVLVTLSRWRKSMKLNYLLPGAAALAAVALVAVNTFQFESLYRPDSPETGDDLAAIERDTAQKIRAQTEAPSTLPTEMSSSNLVVEEHTKMEAEVGLERKMREKKQDVVSTVAVAQLKLKSTKKAASPYAYYEVLPQSEEIRSKGNEPAYFQTNTDKPGDRFESFEVNPLKLASEDPVSTFSIDVDTASYSYLRASLNRGVWPDSTAVRIEEMINYFPYEYPLPDDKKVPFSLNTTLMPTPWNKHTRLLHIGIKGYDLAEISRPKANLVFLIDTSGSMFEANKLPLLVNSFKLLLSTLADEDTVSIVSYAGNAGTVLEPTSVKNKAAIVHALSMLGADGSTAGAEGIELAYQLAAQNFDAKGINRVILATDGDFNVGISDPEALKRFIDNKRNSGVFLSVLGFGMGNYHDALMQALAQNGNGNAAYIDSLSEARKVLVDEASSTLFPIAKDVKIQIEFNPAVVSEYRLIGYETRVLSREDFNNDKVDAGDIGAGHTVTAIYEITPIGSSAKLVDDLRYQNDTSPTTSSREYGYLKLRYKLPNEDKSHLLEQPILVSDGLDKIEQASKDARFSVAVAAYGQLLGESKYMENYSYNDVISLAMPARGEDRYGYRNEFISLVRLSKTLAP